jgi:hypothetical protein
MVKTKNKEDTHYVISRKTINLNVLMTAVAVLMMFVAGIIGSVIASVTFSAFWVPFLLLAVALVIFAAMFIQFIVEDQLFENEEVVYTDEDFLYKY